MLPQITIVTPSFNQGRYIERTLLSVLDQGYPNLEYIVVDGGSTDASIEIIRWYGPRLSSWVSEPDNGQADAINKGFAQAHGEVFTWLNSDDVLLPGALALVGKIFARYPQITWLTGLNANLDTEDHLSRKTTTFYKFRPLIRRGYYHGRGLGFIRQEGTFWRRELWERTGNRVDVSRRYTMDYDLWLRFAQYADLVTVGAYLAAFRQHESQKTAQIEPYYREAGITLPEAARWMMLPIRAMLAPISSKVAPRVVYRQPTDTWEFVPGDFFTPGIS